MFMWGPGCGKSTTAAGNEFRDHNHHSGDIGDHLLHRISPEGVMHMGLYIGDCAECGKTFKWFSGAKHQLCAVCVGARLESGSWEVEPPYQPTKPLQGAARDVQLYEAYLRRIKGT